MSQHENMLNVTTDDRRWETFLFFYFDLGLKADFFFSASCHSCLFLYLDLSQSVKLLLRRLVTQCES